jgi:hypothetical protein
MRGVDEGDEILFIREESSKVCSNFIGSDDTFSLSTSNVSNRFVVVFLLFIVFLCFAIYLHSFFVVRSFSFSSVDIHTV